MCGDVDKDGHVSLPIKEKEVFDGPFSMMDAMFNKAYLLSACGDVYEVLRKNKIRLLNRGSYQKIACGMKHLVALDVHGVAHKYGQWFDGEYIEHPRPFHANVIDIVSGDYHCILLQENGEAVCCGEKEYLFDPVPHAVKIYAAGKSSLITGRDFNKYYGGKK
jgi:hypothetical protein